MRGVLYLISKYELVKLFAPEHGIRGELQANVKVESYVDERFDPVGYVKEQKPLLEEFRARSEKYYIYH